MSGLPTRRVADAFAWTLIGSAVLVLAGIVTALGVVAVKWIVQ